MHQSRASSTHRTPRCSLQEQLRWLLAAWSVHLHLTASQQGERLQGVVDRLQIAQNKKDSPLQDRCRAICPMKRHGSAQFYPGLLMDMTAQPIEVHLRTDANKLATTAASTRLPEQKEAIHMIQMLRQEACIGQMHDLVHVLTQRCLADPLTKKSVSPSLLISTMQTGVLREVDTSPLEVNYPAQGRCH